MSQMCPSSSHQLVAATIAFRRARKKFPKNFGQHPWPDQYEQKESKSEPLPLMKTCKKCEERFACQQEIHNSEPLPLMTTCKKCEERFACQQEIHNVRSNDVWPQFTTSWSTDPRSSRSMRENGTFHRRRKAEGTTPSCGGCACRRICRSTKRNVVVSFREEGKSNNRCSGGDGAAGRSSVETISCKSCQIRGKPSDCSSAEKRENFEDERRRKTGRKSKTMKHRACFSQNSTKNDHLDLLYDRSCMTNNAVSFLSKEHDENSSLEDEDESLDFPSKLHEWENRAHEDSIERTTGCARVIIGDGAIASCDCARKHGEARSECHQECRHQHRHHSHPICHERERYKKSSDLQDILISTVLHEDLLPKAAASRASSTKESNRLYKDCAFGQCPRNSALVGSVREDHEAEEEEDHRSARVDDACAIKHKDSMALLVEKFKNKKTTSCSDDETIFKSDEDSASRTKINEKTIAERTDVKEDYVEYEESQDEDVPCCKIHRNTALSQSSKCYNRTSSKNLKSRQVRSGCCCSSKEASCRHIL